MGAQVGSCSNSIVGVIVSVSFLAYPDLMADDEAWKLKMGLEELKIESLKEKMIVKVYDPQPHIWKRASIVEAVPFNMDKKPIKVKFQGKAKKKRVEWVPVEAVRLIDRTSINWE